MEAGVRLEHGAVAVGEDLGSIEYGISDQKLARFRSATGDPGALYPAIASKDFYYLLGNRYEVGLMLHAKHESWYRRPPVPGCRVVVRGRVVGKYVRRGRGYVVVESESSDESGDLLVRSLTTFHPIEPEGGARPGAARSTPERDSASVVPPPLPMARRGPTAGHQIGELIGPLRRLLTAERMEEFERCSENIVDRPRRESIHVNPGLARQAGQTAPVASGMHSVAHLGHLLRDAFGDAWTRGGHLAVSHIRPLHAGDELIAMARVTGTFDGPDGPRLSLDVWCESGLGQKSTVGSADVAISVAAWAS